jgi:hypothetical protein
MIEMKIAMISKIFKLIVYLLGFTSTLIIFKFDIGIGNIYLYDLFFYSLLFFSIILVLNLKDQLFLVKINNIKYKIFLFSYISFLIILILSIIAPILDNANISWILTNFKASINKPYMLG